MAKKKDKDIFFEIHKAIDKLLANKELKIQKEYRKALASVKQALAEAFEKYSDNDILTREEMGKYGRLTKLLNYLVEVIQKLTKSVVQLTANAIKETFTESYYRYGYFIENRVEKNIFKMVKPNILEEILHNPLDLIKWEERIQESMNALTRGIKEILSLGLAQGIGYKKLAKQVSDKFGIGLNKSLRIVRTESRRAQESANQKSMEESFENGVLKKKMWISGHGANRRHFHGEFMDGQTVGIKEMFTSGLGNKALAPHQFMLPEEDINCRCTMIVVFDDEDIDNFEDDERLIRDDNGNNIVTKYKPYKEWLKEVENR